jgi:signal transduction histidine kinase
VSAEPAPEGRVRALRRAALLGAFAALYTVGALLTYWYLTPEGAFSFFPPAGLTLATLLLAPRKTWPVWLATIAVTEITIDLARGGTAPMAFGWALANVAEPVVGATLMLALVRRAPHTERRMLWTYVACAVVAGPCVGGLIGSAVSTMGGIGGFFSTWGEWWLGDALGVLVVATPILAFARREENGLDPPGWELALIAVIAAAVAVVPPVYVHESFAYAVLPVMIIAALRGGPMGVGVSGFTVGFAASWVVASGRAEIFTTQSREGALIRTQLFIAITILTALTLAVEVVQRLRIERRLVRAETQRIEAEIAAMEAAASERQRIARETHDILGHALNVMILSGAAARQVVDNDQTQAKELLATIEDVGREAFRDLDVALGLADLSPDAASLKGLADLDELVGRLARTGMQVDYEVEGAARPLPKLVDGSAYRIIQESLTNIAKHAANARGHVHVRFAPTALLLEVTDGSNGAESPNGNGHGADRSRNGKAVPSRGLAGMRERVAVLGGHLEAGPIAGGGFAVTAELPLESESR